MNKKPQLVLDAAGVVVTNFSSSFWREMTEGSGISFESFIALFQREMKEVLWTGKISEKEFWEWLNEKCPAIEDKAARRLMERHIVALPAYECLADWSSWADIHLLSNHRREWLEDILKPVAPYIKTITISSEVGLCKPDPSIYKLVHSRLEGGPIMYVDDQEKNLDPARQLGWKAVLADQEGAWVERVEAFLKS
ncbi:HAD family hydrolase [Paenibacillus sp. J2TS4]|uniref:HAD family hydrolase n=1 Tax=Paenibacillus sp. J2TS4 TaxID=2807194 RepID=UPI001B057C6C|nr:HAD-IA family hydrolase [Paenibacillus sp. J2TS4]GIP31650.1 hypothetical protein J2TS4_08600 [Paenibacillus sp. J2TS4]